jgi:hypothetical protein
MARRKRKKSYSRKSRRMGAAGGGKLMDMVAVIGGSAVAGLLTSKLFPNLDDKIKNAAVIGVGGFLMPKVIKGSIGSALGMGMVAAGGLGLLRNFGVISGVDDVLEIPVSVGEIEDNISVISGNEDVMAGDDELAVLTGDDEDEY